MSSFAPVNFEEALLTHKPLRRRRMTTSLPPDGKTPLRSGITRQQGSGLNRRPSSAVPYATNSLKARKKKTGKRKKLPSIKNLRKRVWAEFSIYIRTRDADEFGMVLCCTCPARHHWNSGEIHAGHWIHGRLDFDERNIHGQCRNDNFYSHTKVNTAYACFMAKTYGAEVMDELRLLSNTISNKLKRDELNELLEKYKALNATHPLLNK